MAHDSLPDLTSYDAVLFDLDGVLTPTAEVHMHAWQTMFEELFAAWDIEPPYSERDYFDYLDGKKRYDGVASLLRSRDVEVPWGDPSDDPSADTVCGIGNRKNAVFSRVLRGEGIVAYPGSVALLDELEAAGIPTAVVSSSKNAEEVLRSAGLRERFTVVMDGVIAERDHLASKPAPDVFVEGARMLGVDPARSVAVEDAHQRSAVGRGRRFRARDRRRSRHRPGRAAQRRSPPRRGRPRRTGHPSLTPPRRRRFRQRGEACMIDRDRFPVDPWSLVENTFSIDDVGVTETLFSVGNGYLGLRGNHIEGRFAHEHGTFINGFHETFPIRHAEQAYGFAEVGQTIINSPDAKIMRVYVDDEPLSLDVADVREYERVLDMRAGVLRRRVRWTTPSGKEVLIEDDRLVSFEEKHLAILRLEVTVLNADAPVTINCQVLNRQDGENVYGGTPSATKKAGFDPRKAERIQERVLQPEEYWQDGGRSALSYRVTESGMTLAVVADHIIETENEYNARTLVEPDIAKNVFRVQAKAGVPIRVTKLVSYHSSRGVPARELVDRCRRTLDRVEIEGVERQYERQRVWLDGFWERSDVRIGGHDDLQQATRWCLFQLAQAAARADGQGVPAKGVTGSGYSGHYFWDTEIYVLPFLAYTTPLWARNAMRMRYLMLPAARRRAHQLNEARRALPVAHDQRRRGLGVLRGGYRAVPHQRRRELRAREVRPRHGGCRVPPPRGRRHRGRDRPPVGHARLLAHERRRRRGVLPHPRRDRTRRVHDGRERQPVHERHGAIQPALRRPHRPRDGRGRARGVPR